MDVEWMRQGPYLTHGLHWRGDVPEFIPYVWDDYSEGVILYRTFNLEWKPRRVTYDLPLFVYYFPLAFFDDDEMVTHLRAAVAYQKRTYGCWGLTACDGPNGYTVGDPDLISPLAILTVAPYIPEAGDYLARLGVPSDTPSLHRKTRWTSTDRLGIDDMCYVAITRKHEEHQKVGRSQHSTLRCRPPRSSPRSPPGVRSAASVRCRARTSSTPTTSASPRSGRTPMMVVRSGCKVAVEVNYQHLRRVRA